MLYNTFFSFWQVVINILGKIKSDRFDFLDDDNDLIDDNDLSDTEEYCKCNLCRVFKLSYLL